MLKQQAAVIIVCKNETKLQVNEIASKRNYKCMKLQVDEIASWWNDKLIKWQVNEMAN